MSASQILARLREPSTYAGIGVIAMLLGKTVPPDLLAALPHLFDAIAIIAASLGVIVPEKAGQ